MSALVPWLLAAAGALAPAHCAADEIRIEVLPFELREDYSVPYAELAGVDREVGLVRETLTVKVSGCSATVGYTDPVLYVAHELRADACAFQTVLAHEQQHVAIYREALGDLDERIRRAAGERSLFDAAVQETVAVRAAHDALDRADAQQNSRACGGRIRQLTLRRDRPFGRF